MKLKGWSEMVVSTTLGISRKQVEFLLSLVDAPKEVMKMKGWSELAAAANLENGMRCSHANT